MTIKVKLTCFYKINSTETDLIQISYVRALCTQASHERTAYQFHSICSHDEQCKQVQDYLRVERPPKA